MSIRVWWEVERTVLAIRWAYWRELMRGMWRGETFDEADKAATEAILLAAHRTGFPAFAPRSPSSGTEGDGR